MMTFEKKWLGILLAAMFLVGSAALYAGVEMTGNSSGAKATDNTEVDNSVVLGAWQTNSPIPVTNGLSQTTLAAGDGVVYSIGGGIGAGPDGAIDKLIAYDPASDTYTELASVPGFPDGYRAYGAAVNVNGLVYVFGGISGGQTVTNKTSIYDPSTDTWSAGADMPQGRFGATAGAVAGKIYVAGGGTPDFQLAFTNFEYDTDTDTWATKAAIPASTPNPFRLHGVGDENAGVMHAFAGGFDGRNHLIYDPMADAWSNGPLMPFGVTDPGVVIINTNIYVLGGPLSGNGRAQIFDTVGGTWSQGPMMPSPINNTSAAAVDGTIYVIGGFNGTGSVPFNYSWTPQ